MKIVHITATHFKKNGGMPYVLYNLMLEQNRIESVESRVLVINTPQNVEYEHDNITVSKNPIKIVEMMIDADVICIHGIYFPVYLILGFFAPPKIFIIPHGSLHNEATKHNSVLKKKLFLKLFFTIYGPKIKKILFLSENEKGSSSDYNKYWDIIPNGVDEKRDVLINKNKRFLYIGRIDYYQKGLDVLIQSWKKVDPSNHLVIAGAGSSVDEEKLVEAIEDIDNISFIGPKYDKEKDALFRNVQGFVLSSRHEGFPITVLEALSYGLPILVTDKSNVNFLIKKFACGVTTTIKSFENDLVGFIKMSEQYDGSNSLKAATEYNWRNIAGKSIRVYADDN